MALNNSTPLVIIVCLVYILEFSIALWSIEYRNNIHNCGVARLVILLENGRNLIFQLI